MNRAVKLFAMAACTALVAVQATADAPPQFEPRRNAEAGYSAAALDAYDRGYVLLERATRFDHDAAEAMTDRARQEAMRGAAEAYQEALDAFEQAVRAEERMYEAHTYIGYANRKLGRYERALSAYARALEIKPDYARAIEYQGEAYLGLDRFEDAKFNYLRLYALDAEQAGKLLDAAARWLAHREQDPRGMSKEALAAAAAWLKARRPAQATARTDADTPW